MGKLYRTPGVRFFDFTQADAYTRRFPYLNVIELPMGAFDFAKNLPPRPVHMVAPTAELVARDGLHPALSDLLIEAAREVHGRANLMQRASEFPAPLVARIPHQRRRRALLQVGQELPVPHAAVLARESRRPRARAAGADHRRADSGLAARAGAVRWRVKSRIYRWYGALIAIEREALSDPDPAQREALIDRVDAIEDAVNRMKMPLAFADQFYVLREHIGFVRQRLTQRAGGSARGRMQAPAAAQEARQATGYARRRRRGQTPRDAALNIRMTEQIE